MPRQIHILWPCRGPSSRRKLYYEYARNALRLAAILVALASPLWLYWGGLWLLDYCFNPFRHWTVEAQPWLEVRVPVTASGMEVVFLRRHAHPFLAEYDRKLRLVPADGREPVEIEPPANVGGKTFAGFYSYPAATLEDGQTLPLARFVDAHGDIMMALDGEPRIIEPDKIADLGFPIYLGYFKGASNGSPLFVPELAYREPGTFARRDF